MVTNILPWANMNFLSSSKTGVVRMRIESSLPGTDNKKKLVITSNMELKEAMRLRNILDTMINHIVDTEIQ
jgi:hypothetical protein